MRALKYIAAAVLFLCWLVAVSAEGQAGSRDFVRSEGDSVRVNTATFAALTEGTFMAWHKPDGTGTIHVLWCACANTGTTDQAPIRITGGGVFSWIVKRSNVFQVNAASSETASAGVWQNWAIAVDSGGNLMYIDGAVISPSYSTGSAATASFFDDPIGINAVDIGRRDHSAADNYYDGLIAHVQVWDRALSAPEISRAMRCPGSVTKGLVSYWPLGPNVRDFGGGGVDGADSGTTAVSDGPPVRRNCALAGGL